MFDLHRSVRSTLGHFGCAIWDKFVARYTIRDCQVPLVCAPFGSPQLHRQIGLIERTNGARALLISQLHELLVGIAQDVAG